jgi:tricorn protease
MKKNGILLIVLSFVLITLSFGEEETRLLRFPAVYGDQVVFTYAGDLYTVKTAGGVARKLTNHNGFEMFPRFSPDGSNIAFTAQYDGNTEVYLIPAEGGVPKRITYTANLGRDDVSDRMGPNNLVMGWKHDNKHIVFRSRMREPNSFNGQLYVTCVEGGLHKQLPLPRGGFCSFSPDDSKLAYNRIFREFRTWKRYRGGMADDVWIYDFKSKQIRNITKNPAQDIIPMWKGDKVYFLSDRDENKKMNLFVYDLSSQETKKLTNFKEFDIKFPSLAKDKIAFENGGYIYLFDTKTEKAEKLTVYIREDRLSARAGIKKVKDNITNFEISPDGQRALFGARGEIFTVPAKYGNTRNLTKSPGIHERNSKWSPDGKWIAYISDKSGENEIYIKSAQENAKAIQITQGADTYKYQMFWSPDSKKLLWGDKKLRLRYVDIEKKQITEVTQAKAWEIRNYSWAPDSSWIAYSKPEETGMNRIYIYSLEKAKNYPVTDEWYEASNPVFCPEGKYLYFTSARDFRPLYSWTEWNHVYNDMLRIYLVTLNKGVSSPFKPKSDEVAIKKEAPTEKGKTKKGKKSEKKETKIVVKIDIEGLNHRIEGIPIRPSNYFSLAAVKGKLYYLRRGLRDEKTTMYLYDLKKQKETQLGAVNGYEISANLKKMLVLQGRNYAIIDLPSAKISVKETLKLSGLEMYHCKKCEWKQIFNESWRQMRDFFFIPTMHGVDWKAMKARYAPLIKHVNHRNDLTYIIGEMIGELNVGHTYVGGGERPTVTEIEQGLLGAQFEKDAKTGFYRIKKILKGENWKKSMVSPLTVVGVNAKEGDFITEINGRSTAKMNNLYSSLVNTAGKQVTLKLNSTATSGGREVVVVPINSELDLYYYNMVQTNIGKVNKATNGKVGYIHIPDMGVHGLNEFVKYYYPQLRKKALIIDVRGNGGGNVSPMVIERLRRKIAMITIARNSIPNVNPGGMMWGPMVCLIDEFSASDGDIFPYRFKKHKLGKLIGKRTWGGVVGIRGSLPLLDGGQLFKPEFSRYDVEGKEWIMEGKGVEPDIYVDNDPAKEFAGIDQQLNKAIEVILKELKTKEKKIPPAPPYPDKSNKNRKNKKDKS